MVKELGLVRHGKAKTDLTIAFQAFYQTRQGLKIIFFMYYILKRLALILLDCQPASSFLLLAYKSHLYWYGQELILNHRSSVGVEPEPVVIPAFAAGAPVFSAVDNFQGRFVGFEISSGRVSIIIIVYFSRQDHIYHLFRLSKYPVAIILDFSPYLPVIGL